MHDVAHIQEVLTGAGRIAMRSFGSVTPQWKESQSYVTEADIAVQSFLRDWLRTHYPGDGIIAEEEDLRLTPAAGERYWIIDPIDGTASFVAGLPVWGIGLALVVDFRPVVGYFFIPMTGDFYHTTPGGGVYRNGQPTQIKAPGALHHESLMLTFSRVHREITLRSSHPGKVRSLGSTIAHMCYTATGSADVAVLGRVCIWDLAPGLALLSKNGGVLRYLHGPPVRLEDLFSGNKAPSLMICGHPDTVALYEDILMVKSGA